MKNEHKGLQRKREDESHGYAYLPCFYTILTQSNMKGGFPFRNWCGGSFSQSTRAISVGGGNEELRKLDIQVCRKAEILVLKGKKRRYQSRLCSSMQNAYRVSQFSETCMRKD